MPAGVSQHQAGPGPSCPVAAYPARRHRAVMPRSRAGGHVERGGQQVIGRAAVLAAQHQPVNVALLDLDRPGVGAGGLVAVLSSLPAPVAVVGARRARPPARFVLILPARRGATPPRRP